MDDALWGLLDKIDQKTYKLEGVASVIALIAEKISEDDTSGALWLCSDILKEKSDEISELVAECMYQNKLLKEEITKLETALAKTALKKGKKK